MWFLGWTHEYENSTRKFIAIIEIYFLSYCRRREPGRCNYVSIVMKKMIVVVEKCMWYTLKSATIINFRLVAFV